MAMVMVAGNVALDFVGTLSERNHERAEGFRGPADLARWFVMARLVDEEPAVTERDLAAGIALREALYHVVCALIDGDPLAPSDLALMNAHAAKPGPSTTVDASGKRHRRGSASQCLSAVAAAGVDLFDRDDGARPRWCADERCTHPFLDRSRNKQRRWCDMATCGDRAKVRSYRGRQRAGSDGGSQT